MSYSNFTPRSQQVLALARKEADRLKHNYVGTEHVLLGLLRLGQGVAVNVLQRLGLDLETVRIEVEKQVGAGPNPVPTYEPSSASEPIRAPAPAPIPRIIPYTPRVKKVLALAGREAKSLNHSYVGTEHILLGLLREGDGVSARILRTLEVHFERTRAEVLQEIDPHGTGTSVRPDRQGLGTGVIREQASYEAGIISSLPTEESPRSRTETPPDPALAPYLAPGERQLWIGRPQKKYRFERKHLPALLFIIPFFAFMIFPVAGIWNSNDSSSAGTEPAQTEPASGVPSSPSSQTPTKPLSPAEKVIMTVFLVLFFGGIAAWTAYCMGFTLGGNAFLQGETLYGITNERLIVVAGKKQKTVRSIHLGSATDLRMKEWPDGLGSISFGPEPIWPYASPLRASNTLLENIANPRKVFQLIIAARKNA